jgi:hypothetical protein
MLEKAEELRNREELRRNAEEVVMQCEERVVRFYFFASSSAWKKW